MGVRFDYLGLSKEQVLDEMKLFKTHQVTDLYVSKGRLYVNDGWFKYILSFFRRFTNEDQVVEKHRVQLIGHSIRQGYLKDKEFRKRLMPPDEVFQLSINKPAIEKQWESLKNIQEIASIFKRSDHAQRYEQLIQLNRVLNDSDYDRLYAISQDVRFDQDIRHVAVSELLGIKLQKDLMHIPIDRFLKICEKFDSEVRNPLYSERMTLALKANNLSEASKLQNIRDRYSINLLTHILEWVQEKKNGEEEIINFLSTLNPHYVEKEKLRVNDNVKQLFLYYKMHHKENLNLESIFDAFNVMESLVPDLYSNRASYQIKELPVKDAPAFSHIVYWGATVGLAHMKNKSTILNVYLIDRIYSIFITPLR